MAGAFREAELEVVTSHPTDVFADSAAAQRQTFGRRRLPARRLAAIEEP